MKSDKPFYLAFVVTMGILIGWIILYNAGFWS